jgi:CHAT domain-containing protein/Tfp pilus assembly protein PilF
MRTRYGWVAVLAIAAGLAGTAAPQQPPNAAPKPPAPKLTAEQIAKLKERDLLMKELPDLEKAGKLAVAVAVAEKAAALQREVVGEKSATLVKLFKTVGRLGLLRDDWAGARAAYRKAGDVAAALFGVDDWEVTDTRLALAEVDRYEKMAPDDRAAARRAAGLTWDAIRLLNQGKYADARRLFEEAIPMQKRVLGDSHPDYALSLDSLGTLYTRAGARRGAEPLYREALAIRKRVLGENHPDYAVSLSNLAVLFAEAGQYAKAEPLHLEAVAIQKRAYGVAHPGYAATAHGLAVLYAETAQYAKAEALYKEVLAVWKKALGEGHPQYAAGLSSLSVLYAKTGEYGKAAALQREALAIRKRVLGADHPEYAKSLNSLAVVYSEAGEYGKAEPLHREALAIKKRVLGENHPDYVLSLENLGVMYAATGDYAKAEAHYVEALEIRRRTSRLSGAEFASALSSLAVLYARVWKYELAEPLVREALAIRKDVLGESHPEYAESLDLLATVFARTGRPEMAEPRYREALAIRKRVLGETHPDSAMTMSHLATLLARAGDYAKAELLFREAVAAHRRGLGEGHPHYATSLNNLAVLYTRMGDHATAEPLFREALAIHQASLDRTAAAQVEGGQLAYAGTVRYTLSAYLTSTALVPDGPAAAAYASALRWKGQVFVRQRQQRELARAVADPATADLAAKLLDTTRRLAAVSRHTPKPDVADAWKAQLAALAAERETLERGLVQKSARFRREKEQENLTPDQLRKHLPPGTALVDFFVYDHFTPAPKAGGRDAWEERLAAFVVRPDREIVRVELGPFDPIRDAIEAWRADTKRRRPVRGDDDPAAVLRDKLWLPVAKHLDGATTVLVSPDADLARLPFGALPGAKDGAYLVEELAVAVLPVPQLLPDLLAPRPAGEPSLLAVGDVDYGADPGKPAAGAVARAGTRGDRGRGWDPLPATRAEVDAVKASFAAAFPARPATVLRAAEPTEDAVRRELGKHRWVHLATHGFFAPPAARPAPPDDPATGPGRAAWHDPGLASGVVLAGANRPIDPLAGADDGVLTASEVATLDLSGVDLVVLSACETGLGKLDRTDGVLGLQRAFQVAGARTVVVSLWAVPDEATRALMTRAYASWWDGKTTRLEALVAAQRWAIGNGTELTGRSGPTPPLYWAAFVLAGVWR